ncbi:MAG: bifunctional homocysteine S-methyltransferase/methylenetetrahydrofolate reductase [Bacillota bacterium]|nr:bifunctional homocysteine S-methyltransferase/methylenetetrahydrofolate reductase [Bacillota bacterium]
MANRHDLTFPLLFDGAMGTYYQEKSAKPLPSCEMANLFDSRVILQIHKEYVEAGAAAIKTNTFQANTRALNADMDVVERIIKAGISLAREAVRDTNVKVFADIGPIAPDELVSFADYKAVVDVFLQEGIEYFLFETFSSFQGLDETAAYIKEQSPHAFIIVSFAISPDGQTRYGEFGDSLMERAASCDAIDAVGFNCVSGPLHLKEYLEKITIPDKTISIMPNAGYPTIINGRTFYSHHKDYFAKALLKLLDQGVDIIGGCCGTKPEFIREISSRLADYRIFRTPREKAGETRLGTPYAENLFRNKLENGKMPIAVEYDPPYDLNMKKYIENARELYRAGADAITIADCPVARVRMDASLTAYKIKNEVGIDPIVHLTCRDRNINATKALLLGLNIENILNIILITGDPVPTAERDEVKSVFQFNSTKLAGFVAEMNDNIFANKMNIGGAININARKFDVELERAKRKEEAGVNVFYTQPVTSHRAVENMKRAREELQAYIMGGLLPVVSYRNAVFMNAEISGIRVEDEIIEQYKAADRETAHRLAVEISAYFGKKIADYVDGYYIITPFSRVDLVKQVIAALR